MNTIEAKAAAIRSWVAARKPDVQMKDVAARMGKSKAFVSLATNPGSISRFLDQVLQEFDIPMEATRETCDCPAEDLIDVTALEDTKRALKRWTCPKCRRVLFTGETADV